MFRKIPSQEMGRSQKDWLNSWFHFSFAEYYDPLNMQFGALRVINDDVIEPGTGFETHPHQDMEIITYVIDGELTHGDSMENHATLRRGQVQYMSAGTGIFHREVNEGDGPLRLLQIWVLPDKKGHTPRYGEYRFPWEDRKDRWFHLVSCADGKAPIRIHQDMNIYVTDLEKQKTLEFEARPGRQVYLVVMEGDADIGSASLAARDAAEAIEEDLFIRTDTGCHMLLFEMAKPKK